MPDAGPKASAAPMATGTANAFVRNPEPAGGNARPAARSRQREGAQDKDQPSALSHLIQGGVLLGVLILLFVLAGFRG